MKSFVKWLEQKNPKLFSAIEIIKDSPKKKTKINHDGWDGWKIVKDHYFKEMAVADFGKYSGKHINDIDADYASYLLRSMSSGKFDYPPKFMADDGSGILSRQQIIKALEIRSRNKTVEPTSVHEPIRFKGETPTTQTTLRQSDRPLFDTIKLDYVDDFKRFATSENNEYGPSFKDLYGSDDRIMFSIMVKSYNLFKQKQELFSGLKQRLSENCPGFSNNYEGEEIQQIDPQDWWMIFIGGGTLPGRENVTCIGNDEVIINYLSREINDATDQEDVPIKKRKYQRNKPHLFDVEGVLKLDAVVNRLWKKRRPGDFAKLQAIRRNRRIS